MKKILLLGIMLFMATAIAFAQKRVITGTVVSSDDKSPLAGVSVRVKGTASGVSTNVDGRYSIEVPENATVLTFSYIGFKNQESTIAKRNSVDVSLIPDVQSLSEFVVTSYGNQSKREITGAIASVKGTVFQDLPMQSFDRAMQGRIAGVQVTSTSGQPGGGLTVRVRGVGSINAGNDPLYIVDGVQVASGGLSGQASQNALGSINPNDIESIEVLKDAAAAAIYGAQAANGVVLVTTKKGGKGKTKLRASVQEGIVNAINLYDVMSSKELATIKRDAFINAGLPAANAAATYGDPSDPNLLNTDWVDALYRTGRLSTYDLSLSGGDDKTTFYTSFSHNKQEAQVIMSDFSRTTGRLNLTHSPNKKLSIATNLSLSYQNSFGSIDRGNFINSPFVAGFAARRNVPIYNADGSFAPYPSNHLFGYNIVQGVNQELRLGKTVQTVSNLQLNYKIAPWLSLVSYAGIDFSDNKDDNARPSTIPAFSSFGGSGTYTDRRNVNYNTNHNFNFNKSFGSHTINGTLGVEYKGAESELQTATGRGFANPVLRYLNNAATPFSVGGSFTEFKRAGIFSQVKYEYSDKYTAEVTFRRDGHSRFGSKSRWGNFGAASLGWRLSSESFMKDLTWLDNLRLRASYGVTGNSEIDNFASRNLVGSSGQYLGNPGLAFSQLGNDILTWEEAETFNFGLDWSVFNGRLSGTIDAWRKNSNSLLFGTPLVIDSGFGSVTRNSGVVRNQGIDFDFQSVNVVAGKFKWTSNFNISFQQNQLMELYDGLQRIGNTLIVGKPISFWFMNEFLGVNPANGRNMYADANGNFTYITGESTLRYIGSALPSSFGGFANNFSYGPLSLDVFFQYQLGNLAFNQDLYNLAMAGSQPGNQLRSQLDYWKKPGDITNTSRPFEGGLEPGTSSVQQASTRLLSDGSYIRLKQVTLNYSLPESIMKKIGASQASFFVQGLNLLTFTKYNGIDPESMSLGSTFGAFPNARQVSVGLNLTF